MFKRIFAMDEVLELFLLLHSNSEDDVVCSNFNPKTTPSTFALK